jgi:putative sugar O-methyltransferase
LLRGARRITGAAPESARFPSADEAAPPDGPPVGLEPRWRALTDRSLAGLEACDPVYRPTSFWTPGVQRLLGDMDRLGLAAFKSWPEAFFWFYPRYGRDVPEPDLRRAVRVIASSGSPGAGPWARRALRSVPDATRDFDVARVAWDQERWPMNLESHGESEVGDPTQTYRLAPGSEITLTKPYLNYLLCLAALSRHVAEPPRSFLELGGGYGVLGEILMARDEQVRYVNCDIPPLLTVSSYYLTELFGDRVLTFDDRVADHGPVVVERSACLPNWRIGDLVGDFDVFVNCFSFQEMEPRVVEHYVRTVADLGVRHVVSLNSRAGKPLAGGAAVGVQEQVVSAMIVELFARNGYELQAAYHRPFVTGAAELAVLRRG